VVAVRDGGSERAVLSSRCRPTHTSTAEGSTPGIDATGRLRDRPFREIRGRPTTRVPTRNSGRPSVTGSRDGDRHTSRSPVVPDRTNQ
jgi:hypothetical protein